MTNAVHDLISSDRGTSHFVCDSGIENVAQCGVPALETHEECNISHTPDDAGGPSANNSER